MHDKLLQFQRNDVWTLVSRPEGEHIIGTKWIFRNKTDEEGNVIWNKARLVAQGYSQMEGVDYDETFALVARMESIRILLALACQLKFKFYQMDVKTAFLNGFLKEDIYVEQPKGFIDPHFPDHVPQESTLWVKASPQSLIRQKDSGRNVDPSLYRSMIGSLLYLTASRPDISYSIGVCARYQANPKESHMTALKRIIKYVKTTAEFGVWYSKDTSDVLARYSDADWAGNADDRKSTSGGCFLCG
ncbi:uncharacterized protein LOC115967312 [Quercus lobata]|uniref:uncharacterized protein LOC115967312 n=1 Tax=Quercus lobata TaxID=97700 RepID=UPI001246877E|nr:uncharacterized protein LOC115967312 [Quercus lobata]